jgi:hypothetical protein
VTNPPLGIASNQAEISALCQPKYQVPERPFGFIPNAGNNLRALAALRTESNEGSLILETEIPTLGSVFRLKRLFIAAVSIIDARDNPIDLSAL